MVYPFSFGEAGVATESPFGPYYNPANRPKIDYYSITLSTSRIGGIEYLGLDRSFQDFTVGIATSDSVWERKSWLSFAGRLGRFDFGFGGGLDHQIQPTLSSGVMVDLNRLALGASYRYGDIKSIQGGLSLEIGRILVGLEGERLIAEDSTRNYLHLGIGYELSEAVQAQIGYHRGMSFGLSSAIGPLLFFFGVDRFTIEDFRIHFGIYSIIREKVIKKTITKIRVKKVPVEKKVYVPTKPKKKAVPKKKKTPSKADLKYCDEHYRKGIEYYNQDKLQEAIREWEKVQALCPGYLLVEEYLDKAKKKLKLLKGIE